MILIYSSVPDSLSALQKKAHLVYASPSLNLRHTEKRGYRMFICLMNTLLDPVGEWNEFRGGCITTDDSDSGCEGKLNIKPC